MNDPLNVKISVALTHRFDFSYSGTGAPSEFVFKNYTLRTSS